MNSGELRVERMGCQVYGDRSEEREFQLEVATIKVDSHKERAIEIVNSRMEYGIEEGMEVGKISH